MSAADHRARVRRIVEAALPLAPEERRVLVEIECRDDESGELRAEVERVLEGEVPTEMLVAAAAPPRPAGREEPGERVGPYRIARLLGRGGMGAVYEAHQEHPNRRVAIKMISAAGASDEALRRFRMECEVLASLRHPGIARLLDAGEIVQGGMRIPWFAMDFVEGARPIDRYARDERLDVRARVELLLGFCSAIAYAHGRGVIHRDLKPANMLVDAAGAPRVIDFGIARAAREGGAPGVTTLDGQLLGTPIYMSPEQMDADPDAIDVRVDVYALGVVLYELLAGHAPWDATQRSPIDALRLVRDEPPTPLPAARGEVPRDLAAIVDKAMSPAKGDRYRGVDALADDLRRHLDGRPVLARAHSGLYVAARTVRRHGRAVAAALVLVVAGATIGAGQLRASLRLRATQERLAATTEWVSEISDALEEILQESDTFDRRMPEPRLLEIFGRRAPEVHPESSLALAQAQTLLGLGWLKLAQGGAAENADRALGLFADAQRTIEAVVPAPDARRAEAHHNVGRACFALGRYEEAVAAYGRAIVEWDAVSEAGVHGGEARLLRGTPVDPTETRSHLGACLIRLGDLVEAEAMLEAVHRARRAPGTDDRRAAASGNNLAYCYIARGRYRDALPLLVAARDAAESRGFDASLIVRSRAAIAECETAIGAPAAAAAAIDAFDSAVRVVLPRDERMQRAILALRVEHALALGDPEAAERLAAPVANSTVPDTTEVVAIRRAHARAQADLGRAEEALQALERMDGAVGTAHPGGRGADSIERAATLAFACVRAGRSDDAERLASAARAANLDGSGRPLVVAAHPSLVLLARVEGELALLRGDRDAAQAHGERVVRLLEGSLLDADDPRLARARAWASAVAFHDDG